MSNSCAFVEIRRKPRKKGQPATTTTTTQNITKCKSLTPGIVGEQNKTKHCYSLQSTVHSGDLIRELSNETTCKTSSGLNTVLQSHTITILFIL